MRRKAKRPITLLEIMIVVLLIGIIGSVLGYNMKGSLDEGKAFKSREGIKQIHDIVTMELCKNDKVPETFNYEGKDLEDLIMGSGLVSHPKKFLKDGWGNDYKISYDETKEDIIVLSDGLKKYNAKKGKSDDPDED